MKKILSIFAAALVALAVNAQTDFAAPGYYCAADDAVLTGGDGSNFFLDETLDPHQITWSDCALSANALATWTITATRGCNVTVSLDLGPVISSNKHKFEVTIKDDKGVSKGMLAEAKENADANQVKVLDGTILIPKAGTYTVELYNNRDWGKGHIKNVILTYESDGPSEIVEVESVALDNTELTIDVNETAFLHATVLPENATDKSVSWSSSNSDVVTVVDGTIKGIAAGNATITVTAGEETATCTVTVSDAIPSTDFAAPYFLKGTKALLEGNIYVNEADSLHYKDKSVCGTATWKINVLTNGIFEATANYKTGSASGAKLQIVILDKDDNQVGDTLKHDYYSKDGDKALSGSITLLEAGVYTIKLLNAQSWSSAKLNGITLKKTGEVPAKYYITGSKELVGEEKAWHADAIKVINDSYIFEDLAAGSYQLKIARNGTWEGEENVYGYDALTSKIGGLYRGYDTDEDNICFTLADAGDVKVTYIHGEKYTVEGDFVMPTVQIAGSWKNDWTDVRTFEPASDKLTASVTIEFTNNYYEFKLIENGTWKGKWAGSEEAKYYLTRSVLGVNNLEKDKNNLVITPDVAGEYKFTWTYGTGELTVEFPELPDPVYYLGGSFTEWGTGKELMVENDGIWSKTINFESTDYQSFKIVRSVATIVPSEDWLGLADAHTITATTLNLVIGTGNEAIGITPTKKGAYVFTFNPDGNKVSVTYPTATALDNTNADAKVIKTIENGQLVIIKNGIRYNAQGAVVK